MHSIRDHVGEEGEGGFGCGKPIWVTVLVLPAKDSIIFIDIKDGDGIEATVCLQEKAMEIEATAFVASINSLTIAITQAFKAKYSGAQPPGITRAS
ncbi:hypothetical protein SDJN03_21255, partial [Cucurbita argyrosperma subsp. sororia]